MIVALKWDYYFTNSKIDKFISRQQHISYTQLLWQAFRKNRLALWSLRLFYVFLFVGIFADFIANERPIYCQIEGTTYFPVFKEYAIKVGIAKPNPLFLQKDWKDIEYESVWFPPIPYSPNTLDLSNAYKSPSEAKHQHYLGTTELGKDVAAGLVHGTRIALLVGLLSMLIACAIGVVMGSLAGYFGDTRFQISRGRLLLNVVATPIAFFYGFITRQYILSEAGKEGGFGLELLISLGMITSIFLLFNLFTPLLKRNKWCAKLLPLPLDLIVMRLIEIFNSIPALLFLIAIIAVIQQSSIFNVLLIIGFLRWTSIARFVRSELLRIRSLDYIESARSIGLSDFRILFRHALPNGLTPVLILIAFGVASAILIEASLSFLGIGVAPDEMTWGKLLAFARTKPTAWWLAIFPGLAIFISVLIFNLIGEGCSDALDPRKRG